MASRGNVFFPSQSSTWRPEGRYNLDADVELGNNGYADYGLDSLAFSTSGAISSAIIGAFNGTGPINTTQYLTGMFGLGIIGGSFNHTTPPSALSALVEKEGLIPSHSYGFTAGAFYRTALSY